MAKWTDEEAAEVAVAAQTAGFGLLLQFLAEREASAKDRALAASGPLCAEVVAEQRGEVGVYRDLRRTVKEAAAQAGGKRRR